MPIEFVDLVASWDTLTENARQEILQELADKNETTTYMLEMLIECFHLAPEATVEAIEKTRKATPEEIAEIMKAHTPDEPLVNAEDADIQKINEAIEATNLAQKEAEAEANENQEKENENVAL